MFSITALSSLSGCTWWEKHYRHDNIVEEIIEDIIEQKTGLDLDLTPTTPEK